MKTFAIGDIHGCLPALRALLQAMDPAQDDVIVFLGDYVDRGPDVSGTFEFLMDLAKTHRCIFLRGNHEVMMKQATMGSDTFDFWHRNGGRETLLSYGITKYSNWSDQVIQEHWTFMDHSEAYYEDESRIFVHAGVEPSVPISEQTEEIMFWQKIKDVPQPHISGKTVICGHTAQKDGRIGFWGHTICIDTYAYGGAWLTALDCDSGEYLQASLHGRIQRGTIS